MSGNTIINDAIFVNKGYQISPDKNLLDINLIFKFLTYESYWAKGISKEQLQKAIDNSLCFGVYHEYKQIGFARVITDYSTFAYLADVFIIPGFRKQGLSKWLVQTIIQYPEVQNLRRWLLATLDAHGLYKQFGFEPLPQPERFLQIHNPYKK